MAAYHTIPYALRSYLLSAIFSTAIAFMLWIVFKGATLAQNLIISLSIGFSISTAFIFFGDMAERLLPRWLASVIVLLVGAGSGIAIGSTIVTGTPFELFAPGESSIVLGIFFGVIGLAIFGGREQLAKTNLELTQAKAAQAEQAYQLTESQLRLLQAQIEPHFLFNTLSNVSSMIRSNPDGAERTVNNLSRLLRHNLRRTREPVTTLGEELDILQAYLEIQQIRMGSRLSFSIQCDDTIRHQPLPPMLLQPLVENAVKHGIEPAEAGGELAVAASLGEGWLTLTVTDSGLGMQATSSGTGTGLRNIRERLVGLYDGKASLKLHEHTPQGVIATLVLPVSSS